MTILSLIGLLLSVGLWGASYCSFGYIGTQSFLFRTGGVVWSSVRGSRLPVHYGWYRGGAWGRLETHWLPSRKQRGWYDDQYIPFWIPTLLFAVSLWLFHPLDYYRRRKRKKLGLCLKCGYDLRASAERCPECGEKRSAATG